MSDSPKKLFQKAKDHISKILKPLKSQGYTYHNLEHTLQVLYYAELLSDKEQISKEERADLQLAVLFHDTGIHIDYTQHEEISKSLASQFLKDKISPNRLKPYSQSNRLYQARTLTIN